MNLHRFRRTFLPGLILFLFSLGIAFPASATLQQALSQLFSGLLPARVNAMPLQGGCTVNCSAAAPATAELNQLTSFTSTATPSGCAGAPTFQWDFGDSTGSTAQNATHAYTTGGVYNWRLTVASIAPGATNNINTVAGGGGEGEAALEVPFARLLTITRDPLGRGVYFVNAPHTNDSSSRVRIVFLNTGVMTVTIAGVAISPATVRTIAGGGTQTGENLSGLVQDIGTITGLAANPSGELLYFTDLTESRIRVLNVAAIPVSIVGAPLDPGKIRTFADPVVMGQPLFSDQLFGLAYQPITNDLIVADASPSVWRVYRVHQDGNAEVVAGNGESSRSDHVFESGLGPAIPLLDPRAVEVDAGGNILIADSGHARIIRVAANGGATLVSQFNQARGTGASFPMGIAVVGTVIYSANGNDQQILRAAGSQNPLAGQYREACNYTESNCGDGGPALASGLGFPYSDSEIPIVGVKGETSGVYLLDQSASQRGRIRFVNTSTSSVTRAGVTIPAGGIATIAGKGLAWPFDGGKGTGASLKLPVGVATDANRNLFISDTQNGRVRFLNRSGAAVNLFEGTPSAQTVPPGAIATINYQAGAGPSETAPVHRANFQHPQGLTFASGGLFVVDTKLGPFVPPGSGRTSSLVRFINTTSNPITVFPQADAPITVEPGFVATIAGADGIANSDENGDGGFARSARFFGLSDVAVDGNGNIYLAEVAAGTVRKIDGATGIVSSFSLGAGLYTGLGIAPDGRLFITDAMGGRLLRQNAPGGGAFTQLATGLGSPRDVAIDVDGMAIVTNATDHRLLGVAPNGMVSTIAGTTQGFSGDGGAATAGKINIAPPAVNIGLGAPNQLLQTVGVAVTASREIFFADVNNARIRRIGPDVIACTRTGTISVSNPVPTLTSISPSAGGTEGPPLTLTLTGTNFVGNSVVRWVLSDRPTTFVNGTQLKAEIPSTDLAVAGTAAVRVFNPGPGGGLSAPVSFAISNPAPAMTSIAPTGSLAGSGPLTLEIEGAGFISSSVVRWNGAARSTTFVSPTLLSIALAALDLATAGTANVTVFTPPPGGGTTGAAVFTIENPVPTLTATVPNTTQGAGPAFTLTLAGTNFVAGSIVRWDGQPRPTTFVSSNELKADIAAANIASGGEKAVTVFNPLPGGGVSNAGTFLVSNPPPSIASLTPSATTAGGNEFQLTVSGTGLTASSVVRWNGADRPTVFVDGSTLRATIPATDIVNPGTPEVRVFSSPPNGGLSNALTFTITNPVPVVASVEPDRIVAGSSDILITINGSKFVGNSVVQWNGQNRVTTFVSSMQLKVVIVAADVASVGQGTIRVFNPAPEGGTSAPLPFTIFPPNPNPAIASLSKTIAVAGTAGFNLTVTGSNFISSSLVHWNGSARTTTFVSSTELVATIPASDLATASVAQVSVFTPAPGGGTTNPLAFTIASPLTTVSAASFLSGPVAPGAIVAGFGTGLAVGTAVATTSPLPTLLLGTYIQLRDSAGAARQAQLFFVSPAQTNFMIPPQTAPGLATIEVNSGDGKVSQGTIEIVRVALGIFAANADGKGIAAANAVRAVGTTITFEDVAQINDGVWVPRCISLGPPTDVVFLVLYGTGIGGSSAGLTLTATIGGIATPVPFAGAQGAYAGLDQLNVGPIPRQLIGAGVVDVIVRVNGVATNSVQVCIN